MVLRMGGTGTGTGSGGGDGVEFKLDGEDSSDDTYESVDFIRRYGDGVVEVALVVFASFPSSPGFWVLMAYFNINTSPLCQATGSSGGSQKQKRMRDREKVEKCRFARSTLLIAR